MEIAALVIYCIAVLGFAASFNIGALAVSKYLAANTKFEQTTGSKYSGPLPEHIWQTAAGNVLVLVALAFYLFRGGVPETVTVELVLSAVGFCFLANGMRKLLNFERRRVADAGLPLSLADSKHKG